jgi:hypothetical protein
MTRRDFWLGVGLVIVALLLHALVPRYEIKTLAGGGIVRVDRWTGVVDVPTIRPRSTAGQFRPEDVAPEKR